MSMAKSIIQAKIEKAEQEIGKKKKALAKLRLKAEKKPVPDYELLGPGGKPVRLSKLFGNKSELIVVHNMGKGCPYCALWADGFNGMLKHLEDRAGFVVESPDLPAVQKTVAKKRGWKFTFVSSAKSPFRSDMGFMKYGDPWPGVSTFQKDKNGRIYQVNKSFFGPGDNYCATWDLFDLLPKGVNGWEAKFNY
ncbi:MAG: DUF899 family protein [Bdellovibrionota bacterium]